MSYKVGAVTLSTSGINSINLGFQPTWARFTMAGKAGDTVSHMSVGATDGTTQFSTSTFADTTGAASYRTTTKVVSHYERVAGTVTEVVAANWDSWYANGIKLNVTTTGNYQCMIEAGN